jgi:protein-S-isoprenylcysteine O-methyltransferase Ste14
MPIFSTLLFEIIGLLLISRIWSKKDVYLKKYAENAYQKTMPYMTVGIPFFVASMLHAFIPITFIPPAPPEGSITWKMGSKLSIFLFNIGDPTYIPRVMVGSLFVVLGMATLVRALIVFGLDYMSMVYLYYPEESSVQDNQIYSILRHPAYHGIILISIGAIFFRFSIYSIIITVLFYIGMNIHVKFVEEKELQQRFGQDYKEYMETTNALFYHPKHIGKFFKFLLGK